MARVKGKDGVVNVGANAVALVRSFTVEESADTAEGHTMGDNWKEFEITFTEWSGSIEALLDPTDTNGQQALTIGASVSLDLRPQGTGSGLLSYTGTALVTGISEGVPHDNFDTLSITVQGTGALTRTTQA